MKLDNAITQTTSGLFTPIAIGFIQNSIQIMIPWLIVMFVVILTDLISGIRKSTKLGVEVSPSTAFRETMGKMVTYFSWVIMVCLVDVAMGGNATAAKWGCLLVIAIEGGSIVSNILKPHGVEVSLNGILRVILMRSPLNASQEEAEQVIREKKIEQIRKKEHDKWNHKKKKEHDTEKRK
jgi:phage-related holin